ncbi:hypothetical protein X285_04390 [Oenococcus oeni IOEB_9304]|uniref:hypothetical protein n=1 Tax=Oenococcus oeni TaxID=1247 RepID=UPI000277B370|nr:hypothetical protein [Oenococcus oeni]EJO04518.1 hypothetical protein AWRIB422_1464 [Oenococcus oeni AWRIB422]EJO06511.1 hypothetical protein AWRIB548_529 [Oenococcus oeni AWRIB548]KEP85341.1 hypothetical protein X278_08145 [Oenococcus oeni IOEB_0205]KGH66853.1 hypothetical protein X290_05425 [Oenococcus oeni IOEB_B16]KGH69081.1 hypothetical protein X286_04095 [Oenococcus oeni IOEB_9517]
MTDHRTIKNRSRLLFDIMWPVAYLIMAVASIFDLYITRSFTANGRLLASTVIVLIALVIGSVVGYRKFKKDGFIGKKKLNKDEQHE